MPGAGSNPRVFRVDQHYLRELSVLLSKNESKNYNFKLKPVGFFFLFL